MHKYFLTMDKTTIGWIGLGNMGICMYKNLPKAGYPLTVYNRTADKEKELTDAVSGSFK